MVNGKIILFLSNFFLYAKRDQKENRRVVDGHSQYMLTAVVISTIFKDFEIKWAVYVVGFAAVAISLYIGVDMFDKNITKSKK